MATTAAVLNILIRANNAQATAALAQTDAQLKKTAASSAKMSGALKMAGKVGAVAVVTGLGYAAKKAADFEQQLDSLGAVSNASTRQMKQMREQALKAGADTKFSALEAAKAQTELAKGGLSLAQIAKGGLKSALALAAAGELDLAEAAETTANALNLFGLQGRDAMKVADMLATAANATTADVSDFGMALKQGGAVAKMAGLSFRQTVLALEALAKSGVRNSDAGTSLKTALIQLLKPSEKQAELAGKLGLNFVSASGGMKSMADISAMLRSKLGDMTKAQRTAALATLAGTDGVRTLNALYDAGPEKLNRWEAGLAKTGTAAEVAREKQDNLKGALENLQGSVETIAIKLGSTLLPALTTATRGVTGFLNSLSSGKGAGAGFGATVGSEMSKIGAAAGVSSADVRKAGQAISNVFNAVRAVAMRVWPGVRQIIQGQLRIVTGIIKVFSGLLTLDFRQMWAGVKSIFSGGLKNLGGIIRAASAPLRAAAAAAFGPIKSAVSSVMRSAGKLVGDVIAGMLRRFASLFDVASKIPGIGSKFKGVRDAANDAADKVDRLGESTRKLPSRKTVSVRLKFLGDIFSGKPGSLSPSGGPDMNEAIQAFSQRFVNSNQSRFTDLFSGVPGSLGKQSGALGKLKAISASMGLSAGRGPGQGFRQGDPGYHGKGRAFDSSGPASAMLRFARTMASKYGSRLAELIYTPMGFAIKNGRRVAPYAAADHYDHVHVAMQRGGKVPGTGSGDKVRALLEPGEGIINKKAVAAMGGKRAIDAMNAMVPRFAGGGTVSRKDFLALAQRTWGKTAGLLPGSDAMPSIGWGRTRGHTGFAKGNSVRFAPHILEWLAAGGKTKNIALNTILHEFAHTRQRSGLSRNESEGGATWFARAMGPRVFGGGYRNYGESVYPDQYAWTRKNRSRQWMQKGQFQGFQKGGVVGAARFASGGVVARAAHAAGFRGSNLLRAVAEAKGESGWNERAVGDGGWSKGLMQIYTKVHGWARGLNLFDPYVNMRAAMRIYRSQGWGAWHANHAPHVGAARRAIASMGRGGGGKGRPGPKQRTLTNTIGGKGSPSGSYMLAEQYATKGQRIPSRPGRVISAVSDFGPDLGGGEATSNPVADAIALHTEAVNASRQTAAELKASIDETNRITSSRLAVGLREAERALADVFARELGTVTAQRGATPGDGRLARW